LFGVNKLQLSVSGLGCGSLESHRAIEDLGFEERLHELVMRAVAECLCFVADRAGVLARVRRTFFG